MLGMDAVLLLAAHWVRELNRRAKSGRLTAGQHLGETLELSTKYFTYSLWSTALRSPKNNIWKYCLSAMSV